MCMIILDSARNSILFRHDYRGPNSAKIPFPSLWETAMSDGCTAMRSFSHANEMKMAEVFSFAVWA